MYLMAPIVHIHISQYIDVADVAVTVLTDTFPTSGPESYTTAAAVMLTQAVSELEAVSSSSSVVPEAMQASKALIEAAGVMLSQTHKSRQKSVTQACGHALMARLLGMEGDLAACAEEAESAVAAMNQTPFGFDPSCPMARSGLGELKAYALLLKGKAMFSLGLMEQAERAFKGSLDVEQGNQSSPSLDAHMADSALGSMDDVVKLLVGKVDSRWDPKAARSGLSASRKQIIQAAAADKVVVEGEEHPLITATDSPAEGGSAGRSGRDLDLDLKLGPTDPRARCGITDNTWRLSEHYNALLYK